MRLPNNQSQFGGGLTDLIGLAQASQAMGLNDPPPIKDLLSLLGTAATMHQQEQENAYKEQALALEREKMNRLSPEMFNALMFNPQISGNPEAQRQLANRAAGSEVLPPIPATPPETQLPTLGAPAVAPVAGATKKPSGRLPVKSQAAFMGYTPPSGDVEAVLDQNGNIINFVQKGTQAPVQDFVPSPESIGAYGSSKYATAQQMKALGQYLGLAPKYQPTLPY